MHPQGSQNEATEDKGHLEVLAKDLIVHLQVFRLCAVGDIVKNCPEKKNKYLSNCYRLYLPIGKFRGGYIGSKVTKHLVPICRVQGGQNIWPLGNWDYTVGARALPRFNETGLVDCQKLPLVSCD